MPRTAGPAGGVGGSASGAVVRQGVQLAEEVTQSPEATSGSDGVPSPGGGDGVDPLGDEERAAVEHRDRFVGRAPFGREFPIGQVPEDLGVAGHGVDRPGRREPPSHPAGAVGPLDREDVDVEVGDAGGPDPVAVLEVRPQARRRPARHRRAEPDEVAVPVDVRSLPQPVRRVADPPGQATDARSGPLLVERVRVVDVEVRPAGIRRRIVARVGRQVQADPVAIGEAVLVAVAVRRRDEAERPVVGQRPGEIAHREDRAEPVEARRRFGIGAHAPGRDRPTDGNRPTSPPTR
ncbi:MAG TPA: hypothetical protein VHX40_04585 [Acidimicrobiales bacterium]|nr:hypothetical protein [Acidimicrobiales bacterium]